MIGNSGELDAMPYFHGDATIEMTEAFQQLVWRLDRNVNWAKPFHIEEMAL